MLLSLLRRALAAVLGAAAGVRALPQTGPSNSSSSPSNACNGSPSLCDRPYSNITYMAAHDSAFLRDQSTGNSVAGNQFQNATHALDAGLRMLQSQVHLLDGVLRMCHTTCSLLDAGPLDAWLAAVNDWMAQHPSDVVTLLLVNSDSADVSLFAAAFQASGLSKLGFVPAAQGRWPTLQSMISNGTRLVSFVTNINATAAAPHLLPEFEHVFETAFTVTEITGFNCSLDRPSGVGDAASAVSRNLLGLVNHFLDQALTSSITVPDVDQIDTVNSAGTAVDGSLGKHLQQCNAEWDRQPSFVLVDFWDRGSTVQAADDLNGIKDATGRVNDSSTADSGESSAAGGYPLNMAQGALFAFAVATLLVF